MGEQGRRAWMAAAAFVAVGALVWLALADDEDAIVEPARDPGSAVAARPLAFQGARGSPRVAGPVPGRPPTGNDATGARTGVVRGRVVDPDGQPVEGGSLSARCLESDGDVHPIPGGNAVLGEDGAFELLGCDGLVCLDMHHPAYVRAGPWEVPAGAGAVTLRARPLVRLTGQVVTTGGEPVPGATVVALPGPDVDPHALPPFSTTRTSTDGDGAFSLARIERPACDACDPCEEAPPLRTWAETRLTAWSEDHPPAEQVVDPTVDEPVEMVLPDPSAPIEGIVRDAPPGAVVLARSERRPYEVHRAALDPDGAFRVEGVGAGPYTVRVIANRRELARRGGVTAGTRVELSAVEP